MTTEDDRTRSAEREPPRESQATAELRSSVEQLRSKLVSMEAAFEKRLAETVRRHEARLKDQQERLNALGAGREETMRALHETRAELARVSAERDQLQQHLTRIEGMQTETIALGEESVEEPVIQLALPSLDELMASLSSMEEAPQEQRGGGFHWQPAAEAEAPAELLSADLMFPAEAEGNAEGPNGGRVLVYVDAQPPIKYPLFKNVITIGRATTADIQIDDDFISRIHARIITDEFGVILEDADSKNGISVNSKAVARQSLKHGDIIGIGKLRFTFIDIDSRE